MSIYKFPTPDSQIAAALHASIEIAKKHKDQMRIVESHKVVEQRLDKWGVKRYEQDDDARTELLYALLEFHETVLDVLKLDDKAH